MTRLSFALIWALSAACASGASGPPVTEPGAPPPTTAPGPPEADTPTQPGTPPEDGGEFDPDADAVGVRRLWQSSQSGFATPERLVIRDAAGLSRVWQRLGEAGSEPPVDFGRELVVVAASGTRPTGGHSISVGRAVLDEDGELVVEVLATAPGPDCMTTQAVTQPVDVVAVEAEGAKSWRFVEREEVRGCGGE